MPTEKPKLLFVVEHDLLEQIDEQILIDGGHYEKSPMYHSIPSSPESRLLGKNIIQVPDLVKPRPPKLCSCPLT